MTPLKDFVLGTAGHIDHGKTALVRALTGIDTDRLPAEKLRGITIDLGFAALKLSNARLGIVDVPGHERFIRNMLAGASGFDLALLVVAADDSVMPQTREHLEILRLLGLRSGLVAVSKCDLVDEAWISLVEDDIRTLVAGTFLDGCPIVRTSATTGRGICELKSSLEIICEIESPVVDTGLFRMAIDRSFTVAGRGTVVSGTIASGSVAVDDDLEWLPTGERVRVRGLQRHGRPVDSLARGARAGINLAGIHHSSIGRGDEVAARGYLTPCRVLSVEVRGTPDSPQPIRHRRRYRLHIGTLEVSATLAFLDREAVPDQRSEFAQLFLSRPVVAVYGEPFVLREESPPTTVGGGRVLQPVATRVRRRDRSAVARLEGLRSADPIVRLAAVLTGLGLQGWTERSLCRDSGVPIAEIPATLDRLKAEGAMVEVSLGTRREVRLLSAIASDFEERILITLGRLHEASPRLSSIPRARLSAAMSYVGSDTLISGLIDRLRDEGKVIANARTVALLDHKPKLSQGELKLKVKMAEAYTAGGISPPDPSDWMSKSNPRASAVPELLTLLCEEDRIVWIAPAIYLDFEVAAEIRRRVSERLADGSSMSMSELRDLLGTTRKYAVPISEYLDRIGLTHREGNVRYLRSMRDKDEIGPP